jgi:CheY-like chemotaxis protein
MEVPPPHPAPEHAVPDPQALAPDSRLALLRAEGRAELTARAVGLGTWEVDLDTGLVSWDDVMWQLRGLTPLAQAPDARARLAMVHPDDRGRVDALTALNGAANYEFRVIWPDGRQRWLASRSTSLIDDTGRPLRRMGVNWDITSQREAEAALRERDMALRESQTRQQTLARMSHELRTPLNAILGCTHLLRADPGIDPATRQRHLAEVETAGRHLLALVDQVLDLAAPADAMAVQTVPTLATTAMAEVVAAQAAEPGAAGMPTRRRQILYIEDNHVNAMIVCELVARRSDLEVVVAETGADGLRLAADLLPPLVLLDMQLPDMSGTEVFTRLRADPRTASLPCVALSANAMQADIDAARAAGMTDYWTKPLDFGVFAQRLDTLFGPPPRR